MAGFAGALDMMMEDVVYEESDDQESETSRASSKVKAELGVPSVGLDPEEVLPRSGVLASMVASSAVGRPPEEA